MELPRIRREKAGVISPGKCWVIFHGIWMYGPCDSLYQVLWKMIKYWKDDRCMVRGYIY